MVYNTGYMDNRKLTQADFERGPARERFAHLQHIAGLNENSRGRVDEAMRAAVAHVEKTHGLQFGMQGKQTHIDTALHFLDKTYENRRDLKPKERELIEHSLKSHFDIKDEPQEAS